MILNFLDDSNMDIIEELENKKLDKEYNKSYSDLSEEDFLTLVKMDPNSYPKVGGKPDLNAEPIGVGNLASGGNAGLLIRCFRNGEKDFLNEFKRVQDACLKYTQNRGKYTYKNAGVFPTVKDFLAYVESDGQVVNFEAGEVQQKKETTPREKLEVLRQKQFPNIPDVDQLIMVADLDEESDTEHGQVGQIAKTLLLPHYNAGERDFLNKKLSLRSAIRTYYNASDQKVKENPIASYNEKDGNAYTKTIMDFIKDWAPNLISRSNLKDLLQKYAVEGRDYNWWGSTAHYDIIQYESERVGWILNVCDVPVAEMEAKKLPQYEDGLISWVKEYSTRTDQSKYATNDWCTGWPSSHVNSYNSANDAILVACIKRDRVPYQQENGSNWQISVDKRGTIKDLEPGNNPYLNGVSGNWHAFKAMLIENKDVLAILIAHDPFNKCDKLTSLATELDVTASTRAFTSLDSEVEIEPQPFIYRSPVDVIKYVDETGDSEFIKVYELVIEEGVESIPPFQFQKWINLIKIKFPQSLKHIGTKAFAGCTSLVKLVLPPNLETIGMGAFEGCFSLRGNIRLPLSLRTIQWHAFSYLNNKKSISFTISPKRLDTNLYPYPLAVAEEDQEFWSKPGRIKFSDN